MIKAEIKSDAAVIRFHDEHYSKEPQSCLTQLGQIISVVYRRKALSDSETRR